MTTAKLLVVDDDPDVAFLLETYFARQDYEVVSAGWGDEALTLAQHTQFDLILLDIHLPDIDGFVVCERLREQHSTRNTPIIFLTEKSDRENRLHGLELGVVDYMTKPFDMDELNLRVRNQLKRKQERTNPITQLPGEGYITRRLARLFSENREWALLVADLENMSQFRERYGFAVADDVLRSVAVIIQTVGKPYQAELFSGQVSAESFVVITDAEHVAEIQSKIEARIDESLLIFYPIQDREDVEKGLFEKPLKLNVKTISRKDGYADIGSLLKALKPGEPSA
ncbi:hypothetical protein MASR2M15_25530 [Anaerolineales bacterium]